MTQVKHRLLAPTVMAFALTVFAASDAYARGAHGGKNGHIDEIVLAPIFLYVLWNIFRGHQNKARVSKALKVLAERHPHWTEAKLQQTVLEQFMLLQKARADQALDVLEKHMFPEIYAKWAENIKNDQNQKQCDRKEIVVLRSRIVNVRNCTTDPQDQITVAFDGKVKDPTLLKGSVLDVVDGLFRELWTFGLKNNHWVLKEVTQTHGWRRFVNAHIVHPREA